MEQVPAAVIEARVPVTSTPRSVYHQPVSRSQPSGLQTPTVPLKITNEIDFGPIWGPFNVEPRCGRFAERSGKRRNIWPRGWFGLIFGAKPI